MSKSQPIEAKEDNVKERPVRRSVHILNITVLLNLFAISLHAGETFTPYRSPDAVPRNAAELWKDYDARKEPLDVQVIKEWKENGVISRYVTFKVGTFKDADARILLGRTSTTPDSEFWSTTEYRGIMKRRITSIVAVCSIVGLACAGAAAQTVPAGEAPGGIAFHLGTPGRPGLAGFETGKLEVD